MHTLFNILCIISLIIKIHVKKCGTPNNNKLQMTMKNYYLFCAVIVVSYFVYFIILPYDCHNVVWKW